MALNLVTDICIGLVQKHWCLGISSMSGDSSLCDFGKEDSHLGDSEES
jgi:hypothetical protein